MLTELTLTQLNILEDTQTQGWTSQPVPYLQVASSLESRLQDGGGQVLGVLPLRGLAHLLLQGLADGGVQLVDRLQLRPEVLKEILQQQHL